MRTQTCLAATFLLLLFVLVPLDVAAQASVKTPAPTPKAAAASTKCHTLLTAFQGKSEEYFAQMTDEELASINDAVYECATNSYSQMSRLDLAVGAVVAGMVARQMQARTDRVAYNGLLKLYSDVLAKTAAKPTNPHAVTLTISPLPNGYTRTLSIGGNQEMCSTVDAMKLECKKNIGPPLGYIADAYIVAMLATPKAASSFGGGSYLIGCRPELSSSCFSLVPGDYDAEYVGGDGISISDIVPETKPNGPPVHVIFVIYRRGE